MEEKFNVSILVNTNDPAQVFGRVIKRPPPLAVFNFLQQCQTTLDFRQATQSCTRSQYR